MPRPIGFQMSVLELEREAETLDLPLAEARRTVAASYGFLTWRQAVHHLIVWSSAEAGHPERKHPPFERLACLGYAQDRATQYREAGERLAADPTLGTRDIWSAACAGEVQAVMAFLDEDPTLVERRGGAFDWEPLLYATYGRVPGRSTLDVVHLLLQRGANPNAHYLWGGAYRFTALTGAFGHGEGGPANCPEHPEMLAVARALLDAGADPADAQALYNRMFADDESVCLELLLEYGLDAEARCNWANVEGDHLVPFEQQILQYQLGWAVDHGPDERVRLLIEAGADLAHPKGTRSFYERALLAGKPELGALLVRHDAERIELGPVDRLAVALRTADAATASTLLSADPSLREALVRDHPGLVHAAASAGDLDGLRLCLTHGIDGIGGSHDQTKTPLHDAAWNGQRDTALLLLEHGADPHAKDRTHGGTPANWARHAGHIALAEELERLAQPSSG